MTHSKRVKVVCTWCKKGFTLMPSEAKTRLENTKGHVFCSSACFHQHRRKVPKVTAGKVDA